jgi:hypothetical protein
MARAASEESDRKLGGSPRLAAALLLRQALEAALDAFWSKTVPGMNEKEVSSRAELISLPFYLEGGDLASRVRYTWYRLSTFCHHDAYELPPPKYELAECAATIQDLIAHTKVLGETSFIQDEASRNKKRNYGSQSDS